MRSIPTFAVIKATAHKPLPDFVISIGRWLAGMTAMAAVVLVFHLGTGTADAKTLATKPAKARPVNSAIAYTIKKGDTLSAIGARYGVSPEALATVNGLNNKHRIIAGTQLLVPVNAATASPQSQAAAKVITKTVKLGGDLGIARYKPSAGQAVPPRLASRPDLLRLQPDFKNAANRYGVPLELLQSMAWQESGWQNKAISKTGALGVGQLMPDTVAFVNQSLLSKPLVPAQASHNIQMSAAFLRYLLDQTGGDQRVALAAYYQGLGSVRRIGMYGETQQYVKSVMAIERNWF